MKYCCRWRTRRALEWSRQASSCPPLPSNLRSLVLSTHILTQWLSSGNPTHAHMHTVIHPSSGLIRLKIFQLILTLSFMFLHVCLHLQIHTQTHATQHNTSVTACLCSVESPGRRCPCSVFPPSQVSYIGGDLAKLSQHFHYACFILWIIRMNLLMQADLHHPFILEFCQYLLTSCTVLYPKNEWQLGKFLGKCMHTSK